MVIELSGNYSAALPVMVSSLIAYFISRRFENVPLFDMLTRQDGLILPSIEERREQVSLVVEDAMQVDAGVVADPRKPSSLGQPYPERLGSARTSLRQGRRMAACSIAAEVLRLAADPFNAHTAADISSKGPLPMIFPDEALEEVLRWAGDWPILPVVNRGDLGKLEGLLSLPGYPSRLPPSRRGITVSPVITARNTCNISYLDKLTRYGSTSEKL